MARRYCGTRKVDAQVLMISALNCERHLSRCQKTFTHEKDSLIVCRRFSSRGISRVVEDGGVRRDTTKKGTFNQKKRVGLMYNTHRCHPQRLPPVPAKGPVRDVSHSPTTNAEKLASVVMLSIVVLEFTVQDRAVKGCNEI